MTLYPHWLRTMLGRNRVDPLPPQHPIAKDAEPHVIVWHRMPVTCDVEQARRRLFEDMPGADVSDINAGIALWSDGSGECETWFAEVKGRTGHYVAYSTVSAFDAERRVCAAVYRGEKAMGIGRNRIGTDPSNEMCC